MSDTGDVGSFYLVVLDQEVRPNRIKLGFSLSIFERLGAYRTSNPNYPCDGIPDPE